MSALGPKIDLLVPFFISHVNLLTNICQETAAHTEEEKRYLKIVKKRARAREQEQSWCFFYLPSKATSLVLRAVGVKF